MLRILEYDLRKNVKKPPRDEEELKDAIYDLCLQLDSSLVREQLREFYLGVYTVNFVFWNGLVALEAKLIKDKSQLRQALTEIVSHIPPFSNTFLHVIFLLYDTGGAIDNVDEIKKSIEAKGDNILMVVVRH